MSGKNSRNNGRSSKGNGNGRRNKPPIKQPTNFQDKAETKEYNKGKRAGEQMLAIASGSTDNDPAWYTPSNTLLSNVASFPTDLAVGLPISLETQGSGKLSDGTIVPVLNQAQPGVLAFNVVPYVYSNGQPVDPLNLAASALYTAMQVNSSRNPIYQANDLMLYLIAVTSAYSALSWAERAYGTINTYNIMNKYEPEVLVTAQGWDFDDLRKNMAKFRTLINTYAYQLGSFYLPRDISYASRQIFLYEGIYQDANTPKSQFYLYKPHCFLVWTEGDSSSPKTYLQNTTMQLEDFTVAEFAELMEQLINPLRQSEDIRLMASDLIKAFGLGNSITLQPIADNFFVKPEYNEEVLMQFENAYILPKPVTLENGPENGVILKFTQESGINNDALATNLTITVGIGGDSEWYVSNQTPPSAALVESIPANIMPNQVLLNFHKDNPSPEDIMVASRVAANPFNKAKLTQFGTGGFSLTEFARSGSELICGASLYYSPIKANSSVNKYQKWRFCTDMFSVVNTVGTGNTTEIATAFNHVNLVSSLVANFDWFPKYRTVFLGFVNSPTGGGTTVNCNSWGPYVYDLETWLKLSLEEWDRMNEIAMYGLFECTLGEVPRLR